MKTGTLLRLCRVQLASRRTPNGYSLYVRFTENGKQHKQTIGFAPKNNPEAWRRMLEQAKIVAQQLDATLTASISGTLHIVSRDKSFIKFFEDFANAKQVQTRANYFQCLSVLKEFLHPATDLAFGSLSEAFCAQFKDFLLSKVHSGTYKAGTAKLYFRLFKTVVNDAAKRKLLATNPAENITLNVRYEGSAYEKFALTSEEIQAMLSTELDSALFPVIKNIFIFTIATAMRISDVLSVRFSDVKMIQGSPVLVFRMQKTERMHTVPLNSSALAVIEEQRKKALSDDARIFHDAPSRFGVLYEFVKWSKKAIGKRVTPHILRHTAATLMLSSASAKDVSSLLGHKTLQITDHYLHAISKNQIDAVVSIDRLLNARND
jgi:integrase/recombinase XerD